ncbi:MAG: COX15/CtaA family protein, partial [Archangium sp.]|nr:COX15/CtaA family protein [Archangium sp.]
RLLAALASTVARAWLPDGGLRGSNDRGLTWVMAAVVVVGVSGAVTALGDTLQQQAVQSPFVDALIRLRLAHPLLAVAVAVGVLVVAYLVAMSSSVARPWAVAVAACVVVQIGVGLLNVALAAPVSVQLLHLVVADLLWVLLVVTREVALGGVEPVRP